MLSHLPVPVPYDLCQCLRPKLVVGAFNQEKALVGAFSVIVKSSRTLVQALLFTQPHLGPNTVPGEGGVEAAGPEVPHAEAAAGASHGHAEGLAAEEVQHGVGVAGEGVRLLHDGAHVPHLDGAVHGGAHRVVPLPLDQRTHSGHNITRASNEGYAKICEDFTITEKVLVGAFFVITNLCFKL